MGDCVLFLVGDCVVGVVEGDDDGCCVGEMLRAVGLAVVGTSGDAVVRFCEGDAVVALDVGVAEGEPVGAAVAKANVGDFVGAIVIGGV